MFFKEFSPSFDSQFEARYGHRAVNIDDNTVLILGGGNKGYITNATVFNIAENSCENFPLTKISCIAITEEDDSMAATEESAEDFEGLAAFGMVWNETENVALIFGGMQEEQKFSNELLLLRNYSNLECLHVIGDTPPTPRIGHSFTKISSRVVLMFGGLENASEDVLAPTFSNDTYLLHLPLDKDGLYTWERVNYDSTQAKPTPRESHTGVLHDNVVVIFGGANGCDRLNDVWFFDTKTYVWTLVETCGIHPFARSMHSAVVVDDIMYIFGGFIRNDTNTLVPWKCTNNMQCFNILTCKWSHKNFRAKPEPRAGHAAAVESDGRMFIISGRCDFYTGKLFACLHDMWRVDLKKPPKVDNVELEGAETNSLKLRWTRTKNATCYLVEIRERYEVEVKYEPLSEPSESDTPLQQVIVRKIKVEPCEQQKPNIIIVAGGGEAPLKIEQFDGTAGVVESSELVDCESTDSETETRRLRGCWCLAGIFREPYCTLKSYATYRVNRASISSNNVPNLLSVKHIPLHPGRIYFIRVSALNSCGISKFSATVGFRTKCDEAMLKSMISEIRVECHIYFYLISWNTSLVSTEFVVHIEELLETGVSKSTIYKGKGLSCNLSSDLLKNYQSDHFVVRIEALSPNGQTLHEAKLLYKDGLTTEIN